MTSQPSEFRVGAYRPIYLWGGPGTIRMNRLKFMDQPVDEDAHREVHSVEGARRAVEDMHHNWVHLMYDWGFPPEIEEQDWEDFERAAEIYHKEGSKVFAYIQVSNCVYDGSFQEKDWYALDSRGNKIYYYSGRYMVCLNHPGWVQRLGGLVEDAIRRGADGIFFDNMWFGFIPISLFNTWLGDMGCHCNRCQAAYLEDSGETIPTEIDLQESLVRSYLRWRADRITGFIAGLSDRANEIMPGIPISANDYDIVMRPTFLVYGQDSRDLAEIKDITMIENFALPRWDARPRPRLANNALTIRNARAVIGEGAHLSVLSYDVGIGFDPLYPPRRYQQGIAEAAACGASMTTKGGEYYHQGVHTVLTRDEFAPIHRVIGDYNRWLEANAHLYTERRNVAPIALLHPGERLWMDWLRLAPVYLGAGQTLLCEGLPWRVVSPGDDLGDVKVLLVFDPQALERMYIPAGVQVYLVPAIRGWELRPNSLLSHLPPLRAVASRSAKSLLEAYHGKKVARRVMDRIGLPKLITQTPLFNLPPEKVRRSLLDHLPEDIYPRVQSREPVLIEIFRQGEGMQVHLVNYSATSSTVRLLFGSHVRGEVVSPEDEVQGEVNGKEAEIFLDVYKVLLIDV